METIAWYKNKEGLFFLSPIEKILLILYGMFLLYLVCYLFIPFPIYHHYIAVKEESNILFKMPKKQFATFEGGKLYIKEKNYDFVIMDKEEDIENNWMIKVKIKGNWSEESKIVEVVSKGKRKSKISQFMENRRRKW